MRWERYRIVIGSPIRNIFKKELDKKVVCADFAHITQHIPLKGNRNQQISNAIGRWIENTFRYATQGLKTLESVV